MSLEHFLLARCILAGLVATRDVCAHARCLSDHHFLSALLSESAMPACVPAHVPARRGMPTAHWILLRIGVGGLFVCAIAYVLWLSNTANNRDTVQALRATSANINVMDDGQYKPQVVESRLAQTSSKHKPQVVASRRAHDASSNYLEMMERAFGDKVINESLRGGIIINSGGDGGGLIADSSSLARSPRDE